MYNDYYYNTKATSFPDRESFSNTILLLTMIKSQYYYIVGFSRLDNVIEIAFDFESDLHGLITETMTLNFDESEEYLVLRCRFTNIFDHIGKQKNFSFEGNGYIVSDEDGLKYEYLLPKDRILPVSVEKMNAFIIESKAEIIRFLEKQYSDYLSD
jgi:hypothetical protein